MASTRPELPAVEPVYDASRPFPDIQPLYQHAIPNVPGKTIVTFRVTFPPNASTPPHTHAGAFVSVNITSGHVFNKMNSNPMAVFSPGESFFEYPGCHHVISDNASTTEEAVIVATFIVDSKVVEEGAVEGLIVIDEEYREVVKEKFEKAAKELADKALGT